MVRSVALVSVGLLAGCNAIFGLDPVGGGGDDVIDAAVIDALIEDDGRPPIDAAIDAIAIDGSMISDTDGDGLVDGADTCPTVYNLNQDDTDGDGDGDVCDLCPQQAAGSANVDGDGVGDNCGDPSTATPQCIVWFDGFEDPRTLALYTSPTGHGAWQLTGGQWLQVNDFADEGLLHLIAPTFGKSLVLTHGTVTDQRAIASQESWEIGVSSFMALLSNPVPDAATGELTHKLGDTNAFVAVNYHIDGAGEIASEVTALRPMEIGAGMALGIDTRTNQMTGIVRFDDTPGSVLSTWAMVGLTGNGAVGLRTHNVAGAFDFLLVIVERDTATCPVRTEP